MLIYIVFTSCENHRKIIGIYDTIEKAVNRQIDFCGDDAELKYNCICGNGYTTFVEEHVFNERCFTEIHTTSIPIQDYVKLT